MLVSTLNGRVRVRARVLRSAATADRIAHDLRCLPGVIEVRTNPGAGSLVLTFDAEAFAIEELEERIEAQLHMAERRPRGGDRGVSRRINQVTKYGMLATLGTSLAYGYLGRKKAHMGFGAAFLVLAGAHLFRYQGSLLR